MAFMSLQATPKSHDDENLKHIEAWVISMVTIENFTLLVSKTYPNREILSSEYGDGTRAL